jgi:hypothetical protein
MELANAQFVKSNVRRSSSSQQQQRQKFRWWIVLPVVVVSMTTTTTDPVLMNDLMIRRYREQYGLNASSPASETACNTENLQNDSTIVALADQVQISVGNLNILMAGVCAIPAVLTYIILGANCDRIGRRPLLIIVCEESFVLLFYYHLSN